MRNWEVMHRVIDEAHRNCLDIHFDVVVPSEHFPYFTGCANVTLHSRLPEPDLVDYISRLTRYSCPSKVLLQITRCWKLSHAVYQS